MKIGKFGMLAASALLLASCSSDEPAVNNNQGGEKGYMTFSINLPTSNGTRTDFEDGVPAEYDVYNGKVLVWQKVGDDESNATFVSSSDLKNMTWTANGSQDITTSSKAKAELTDIKISGAARGEYKAFVVLNFGTGFTEPTTGEKFGDWLKTSGAFDNMEPTLGGKTYLTMTSAARYDAAATDKVRWLEDIDNDAIKATEAALTKDAFTAFVQRGVAKVEVAYDNTDPHYALANDYTGYKVQVLGWELDVTNTKTFPAQYTKGIDIVAGTPVSNFWDVTRFYENGTGLFNRVYWAVDPNYDGTVYTTGGVVNAGEFGMIPVDASTNVPVIANKATGAYDYCLENTFNPANMKKDQTTRVVIKAQIVDDTDNVLNKLWRLNGGAFQNDADFNALVLAKAQEVEAGVSAVTFTDKAKTDGYSALKDAVQLTGASASFDYDALARKLGLKDATTDKGIGYYKDGVCYYVVRLKHFGDALTWNNGDPTYGDDQATQFKYLGRYGVVRNNVYKVNVDAILAPGEPVIPTPTPDPDDDSHYFIQASINVLSWAVRNNNVSLE